MSALSVTRFAHRLACGMTLSLLASVCLLSCAKPKFSSKGVLATLTVNKTTFHQGDTASITITALNRGRHVVRITTNQCPVTFEVIDPRGSVQMPGPAICLAYLAQRDLSPGESYLFRYLWRFNDRNGEPLADGQYYLRGFVYGQGLHVLTARVPVRIESIKSMRAPPSDTR